VATILIISSIVKRLYDGPALWLGGADFIQGGGAGPRSRRPTSRPQPYYRGVFFYIKPPLCRLEALAVEPVCRPTGCSLSGKKQRHRMRHVNIIDFQDALADLCPMPESGWLRPQCPTSRPRKYMYSLIIFCYNIIVVDRKLTCLQCQ